MKCYEKGSIFSLRVIQTLRLIHSEWSHSQEFLALCVCNMASECVQNQHKHTKKTEIIMGFQEQSDPIPRCLKATEIFQRTTKADNFC